jgi:hypothetical protein
VLFVVEIQDTQTAKGAFGSVAVADKVSDADASIFGHSGSASSEVAEAHTLEETKLRSHKAKWTRPEPCTLIS